MNANIDNMEDKDIKQPVRMPEEDHDRIMIDDRRKHNEPK